MLFIIIVTSAGKYFDLFKTYPRCSYQNRVFRGNNNILRVELSNNIFFVKVHVSPEAFRRLFPQFPPSPSTSSPWVLATVTLFKSNAESYPASVVWSTSNTILCNYIFILGNTLLREGRGGGERHIWRLRYRCKNVARKLSNAETKLYYQTPRYHPRSYERPVRPFCFFILSK